MLKEVLNAARTNKSNWVNILPFKIVGKSEVKGGQSAVWQDLGYV